MFYEKPPSPKYIPKKTGIDAATQVEDYELFDFDREVAPICNVIATKILEQVFIINLMKINKNIVYVGN